MNGIFTRGPAITMIAAVLFMMVDHAEARPPELGRIQTRSYHFKSADRKMRYSLYVPSTYRADTKTPLIVALHGLFSNHWQMIRYPGLTRLAEKHGYIVVAPMGYNFRGWYGSEAFLSSSERTKRIGQLSEEDVMNVLSRTRSELNIDSDRIYLMGHSMGGGGAWHLAIKYPHLWAAIAPIAPAIYRPADALEKIPHIPVIVVQGAKDRHVNVDVTRRWVAKTKQLGMQHEYIEDPGGRHVLVAFEYLPSIFDFFDKHEKKIEHTAMLSCERQ